MTDTYPETSISPVSVGIQYDLPSIRPSRVPPSVLTVVESVIRYASSPAIVGQSVHDVSSSVARIEADHAIQPEPSARVSSPLVRTARKVEPLVRAKTGILVLL